MIVMNIIVCESISIIIILSCIIKKTYVYLIVESGISYIFFMLSESYEFSHQTEKKKNPNLLDNPIQYFVQSENLF